MRDPEYSDTHKGPLTLMHTDKSVSELAGNMAVGPRRKQTTRPTAVWSASAVSLGEVFNMYGVRPINDLTPWKAVSPWSPLSTIRTPQRVTEVL